MSHTNYVTSAIFSLSVQLSRELFDSLTFEDGTDRLSRNVSKRITSLRRVIPQKNAVLIYTTGVARKHAYLNSVLKFTNKIVNFPRTGNTGAALLDKKRTSFFLCTWVRAS